jgi:hypothetical protein
MEIEFAQNQKRSWYCTRVCFQCYDMKDGSRLMRSAINSINGFLEDLDKPRDGKVVDRMRGLK